METTTSTDAYGESFADVYDDWYPSDDRARSVVAALEAMQPDSGGRLLELGVGTGALAMALAGAGWAVAGIDSSTAMLAALDAKRPPVGLTASLGDAGEPDTWPEGPYDVVLAAWNLLTNLPDRTAQRALVRGAARTLAPDGRLVVETFVPSPPPRRERRVSAGDAGSWVRVHTDADPTTGVIEGRHVELRDGSVVVRPWRVCWLTVEELDRMAGAEGLELIDRREDWHGAPFVADESATHVSSYQRVSAGISSAGVSPA